MLGHIAQLIMVAIAGVIGFSVISSVTQQAKTTLSKTPQTPQLVQKAQETYTPLPTINDPTSYLIFLGVLLVVFVIVALSLKYLRKRA